MSYARALGGNLNAPSRICGDPSGTYLFSGKRGRTLRNPHKGVNKHKRISNYQVREPARLALITVVATRKANNEVSHAGIKIVTRTQFEVVR